MSTEEQVQATTPSVDPRSVTPKGVQGIVGKPNGKTARQRARKSMSLEQKRDARRLRRQAKGKKAPAPAAPVPAAAAPAKKKSK